MIIDLSNKTAIVTGSTGGVGLAVATGLANAGAQVVVVGRDQGRVDAAIDQIRSATGKKTPPAWSPTSALPRAAPN